MKKKLSWLLILSMLITALAACGGGDKEKPADDNAAVDDSGGAGGADFKAIMITDVGGINDESFNQSAWNGMQRLQADTGMEVSYIESHKDSDYKVNLERASDEEPGMVWGIGFLMKKAVMEAAKLYPEINYALVDDFYEPGEAPNVTGVMFNSEQSSFQVGYIAGHMTETNHVGLVIGMESPTMNRFRFGYFAGVQYAANELGKEIKIDYVNIETFGDAAKGKATAQKMYSDGADIVFHAAGGAGNGVIEAAKDLNKWVIGVDLDQSKLAPDNVITSALKNVDAAVYDLTKRALEGEKITDQTFYYGLKEGGVGIPESSSKLVPADVLEKTNAVTDKIKADEVVVPATQEDYDAFLSGLN